MAKAFGKIKRLIGKKSNRGDKDRDAATASASSSPTRSANDACPSPPHPPVHVVPPPGAPVEVPLQRVHSGTGADDVLDGILQDLNIKVGQLALDVGKGTDTVSEFSGGSAKSVDSDESESSAESGEGEEEETDDDDGEGEADGVEDRGAPSAGSAESRGVARSTRARVAAVVAAAEEIRKKRGATPPADPAAEPASFQEPAPSSRAASKTSSRTRGPEALLPAASKTSSKARRPEPAPSSRAASKTSSKTRGSRSTKGSRASQLKNVLEQKLAGSQSTSPQFSPAIANPDLPAADGPAGKSLDTKDDCDDTKGTMDVSEEEDERSCDASTKQEDEETLDTFGEDTFGTDLASYMEERGRNDSLNAESTCTEDEETRMKTKKTVMNKDIIIHQPGGPGSLVVRAMYYTPLPASPEDIIIKVEASTVSFRDCLLRCGIGPDKVSFPFVPGCEVVGHISNLGKGARSEGYRVGDRVVGLLRKGGGNGYYAKLSTHNAAPIPSAKVSAADVVCLVDVYMTAYQALRVGKKDGTPLTDANVLVTDGFSPLGQAAVTLAKAEGANVYATTTDSRQDEYMKTLGVKCLPLAPAKWLHKLKGKMDIVIDNTCFDSYDSSWKALNDRGVLVCTGSTSIYKFQEFAGNGGCACDAFGDIRDYQAKWSALKARYMMSQTRFHDLWESFRSDPKKYQQELKYLCFLVENGTLKPKIAERVSIEEIADAQRYLETGKANGSIVCLP